MALPPLEPQTPTVNDPPVTTNEPEQPSLISRYFYSSWPEFESHKPEKPAFKFDGRLLATNDPELAAWLLEIGDAAAKIKRSYEIKEITAEEYEKYLTGELG